MRLYMIRKEDTGPVESDRLEGGLSTLLALRIGRTRGEHLR